MITKVRACWGRTQERDETVRRAARAWCDTAAASVFFSHTVGASVLARRTHVPHLCRKENTPAASVCFSHTLASSVSARRTHISHLCTIPTHLPYLCREDNTRAASVSSQHTVGSSVSPQAHALAASGSRKSSPGTPDRSLPASCASLACTRGPFFPSSSGHLPPQAPREGAVASP